MSGGRLIAVVWVLTRALLVWWYLGPELYAHGDLDHYARAIASLPEEGLGGTLVEYPVLAVLLVGIPWTLSELLVPWLSLPVAMLLMGLLADVAFTFALRTFAPTSRTPQLLWIVGVPLLGSVAYGRFDLIPGVLVGIAVLVFGRTPGWASAAITTATALKLWPVVVLPALAAVRPGRGRVAVTAAALGGVLAVCSWAVSEWGRLISPLTWQSNRGLQIESVAATPHMLRWAAGSGSYELEFSRYVSWEISGPGVPGTIAAASLLTVLLALMLLGLWLRAWRVGHTLPVHGVVWLALTGITGLIVTSKVLSPQYLMWLLPLVAAGAAVTEGAHQTRLVRWAAATLVTAAMTHLVFPTGYSALTERVEASYAVTIVLAMRNLALVLLFVWAALESVRTIRQSLTDRSPMAAQVP